MKHRIFELKLYLIILLLREPSILHTSFGRTLFWRLKTITFGRENEWILFAVGRMDKCASIQELALLINLLLTMPTNLLDENQIVSTRLVFFLNKLSGWANARSNHVALVYAHNTLMACSARIAQSRYSIVLSYNTPCVSERDNCNC